MNSGVYFNQSSNLSYRTKRDILRYSPSGLSACSAQADGTAGEQEVKEEKLQVEDETEDWARGELKFISTYRAEKKKLGYTFSKEYIKNYALAIRLWIQ